MTEERTENELSIWLSTYGLITAERILERYGIHLQHEDLLSAIKNPKNFYHQLLRIPLKNVFNGIILQQAQDYQSYGQKLFIDYLMSGEGDKSEDSPGGMTREDLESERKKLIDLGEEFHQAELDHNQLIANSQKGLIEFAKEWQSTLSTAAKKLQKTLHHHGVRKEETEIIHAINALVVKQDSEQGEGGWARAEHVIGYKFSPDLKQEFADDLSKLEEFTSRIDNTFANFIEQGGDMALRLRKWRSDFHNFVLHVNELLKQLPEYHADPVQTQEHLDSLRFDPDIGGA